MKDWEHAPILTFEGVVYRMHNPQWAWQPLSGEGAALHGGRFNPVGHTALYTATDMLTAYDEASDVGLTPGLVSPLTLVSYQVALARVLDLSALVTLFDQPWALLMHQYQNGKGTAPNGWQVHDWAQQHNIDALLVPSYQRQGGINLVVLRWTAETVRVYDPEDRLRR